MTGTWWRPRGGPSWRRPLFPANLANTPGGRPQNHRRSRPWRHELPGSFQSRFQYSATLDWLALGSQATFLARTEGQCSPISRRGRVLVCRGEKRCTLAPSQLLFLYPSLARRTMRSQDQSVVRTVRPAAGKDYVVSWNTRASQICDGIPEFPTFSHLTIAWAELKISKACCRSMKINSRLVIS